jgi:peroxiredoxin
MPLSIGDRPPGFRLRGLDNEYWILGSPDERRSVFVVFFGRGASAARTLLPYIERIHRMVHAHPAEILGISIDSARDTLEFATDYSLTIPILIDAPDLRTIREWDVRQQPVLFRLDEELRIADRMDGFNRADFDGIASRHLVSIGAAQSTVWEPVDAPANAIAAERISMGRMAG